MTDVGNGTADVPVWGVPLSDAKTGRDKMNKATAKSLFIFLSSNSYAGLPEMLEALGSGPVYQQMGALYPHLVDVRGKLRELILSKAAQIADQAFTARRMDLVARMGHLLLGMADDKSTESVSCYYLALSLVRQRQYEKAAPMIEQVANVAPLRYRARAMASLGSLSILHGDIETGRKFFDEAAVVSDYYNWQDPMMVFQINRMRAVLRSFEGDHVTCIRMLERLYPAFRALSSAYPALWFDYLNSFSVGLGDVGRFEEARRASAVVLSSPYVLSFPEWANTPTELLERERRSMASVIPKSMRAAQGAPSSATQSNVSSIFRRNGLPEDSPVTPALPLRFVDPGREASDPSAGRKVLTYPGWTEKSAPSPRLLLKSPTGKQSAKKGSPAQKGSPAKQESDRLSDQVDTMGVVFNGEMPNDAIRALREIALIAYEFRGVPGIFDQMLQAVLGIIGDEQELNK